MSKHYENCSNWNGTLIRIHGGETASELKKRYFSKEQKYDLEQQRQRHRGRDQSQMSTAVINM